MPLLFRSTSLAAFQTTIITKKESNTLKKVTINFTQDSHHFTALINGVWGGPISNDLIEVSFYTETNPRIEKIEVDVTTGQELARYPNKLEKDRNMKFSALMTPNTAETIAKWLMKKVAEARKARPSSAGIQTPGTVQ